MESFVGVVIKGLERDVHRVLFCCTYHFRLYHQLFAAVKDKYNQSDAVYDKGAEVIERPVFTMENKPLKIVRKN